MLCFNQTRPSHLEATKFKVSNFQFPECIGIWKHVFKIIHPSSYVSDSLQQFYLRKCEMSYQYDISILCNGFRTHLCSHFFSHLLLSLSHFSLTNHFLSPSTCPTICLILFIFLYLCALFLARTNMKWRMLKFNCFFTKK